MRSVRVLLVDDEVDFLEPLAARLGKRNFDVSTAESGDEAIARAEETDFDVVVLDIFMPGRDGIDTLRELKQRKPLTEVILLSGRGTTDTAVDGMKLGAYDFLTKPCDVADLVEKINGARARKVEHLARIRRASELVEQEGRGEAGAAVVAPTVPPPPITGAPARLGRLLVLGRQSEFPGPLIEYALDMARRLSYEVVALSAAGFSREAFRSFPTARDKVCQDFEAISEENALAFREAAAKQGIPFSHVVKFNDADEAIPELKGEMGEIDYVICESEADPLDPGVGGPIVAYIPM